VLCFFVHPWLLITLRMNDMATSHHSASLTDFTIGCLD